MGEKNCEILTISPHDIRQIFRIGLKEKVGWINAGEFLFLPFLPNRKSPCDLGIGEGRISTSQAEIALPLPLSLPDTAYFT